MFKDIVEQLKFCKYECEAGPLENNMAFIELELLAADEAQYNADVIELDEEDMIASIRESLKTEGVQVSDEVIEKILNMEVDYMKQVGIIVEYEQPEN